MNGLRIAWIVGGLLVGASALLLVMDGAGRRGAGPAPTVNDTPRPMATSPTGPDAAPPVSTTAASTPPSAAPAGDAADAPRAPRAPVVRSKDAVDLGLTAEIAAAKVIPGNVVPRTDERTGEKLLYADDRFEIRGSGTEADPYRVSWECLASASETYVPRLNENELPQRVALLDGAWLQIEGYLAFPLMVSETKELLVMLNQWDGCCIGVPPTPYDAIEVKLLEPARRSSGHATFSFGGVRGRLRVDPYLVENWLVGLYVLEDASMIEGARPEL
jgi:hypothetical protein